MSEVDDALAGVSLSCAVVDPRPHRVGPYEGLLYEVLSESSIGHQEIGDVDQPALTAQHERVKALVEKRSLTPHHTTPPALGPSNADPGRYGSAPRQKLALTFRRNGRKFGFM